MTEIIFATNNSHKLDEIRSILGDRFCVRSLADIGCFADIPETADTLEGNALLKAQYVAERFGGIVFADDTGLEVDALDGRPGVHTARYAYPDRYDADANTDKLLEELAGKTDRAARFRTAIALIDQEGEHLFSGTVEGTIATERRGEKGFGYDPVFIPEDRGLTFAELGVEVKNEISHRARAVQQLAAYLTEK